MNYSKMFVFLKSYLHLLIGMLFHNYTLVPSEGLSHSSVFLPC